MTEKTNKPKKRTTKKKTKETKSILPMQCKHTKRTKRTQCVRLSVSFGRILTVEEYPVQVCKDCGDVKHNLSDEEINEETRRAHYYASIGKSAK